MVITDREVIDALKRDGHPQQDAIAYVNARRRAMHEAEDARTTMRDGIAARAMPGIYTNLCRMLREKNQTVENVYECVALAAYEQADAMLEARKPKGGSDAHA